jgi:Domain of unknown function (DU1801)
MTLNEQIDDYIASQAEPKRSELDELHRFMLRTYPESKLWFLDGRNADGKIVANPSIGYGFYTTNSTKDFYRVGLSANNNGISVYILGLKDKTELVAKFGDNLGKARVSGYCIKFKKLGDVNIETLHAAIQYRMDGGDEQ